MAYISYDNLWRGEFYNNVSAKHKRQDISLNQLKLKVNDTFKIYERMSTTFEPSDDSDVINKAYLDENLSKENGSVINNRKSI